MERAQMKLNIRRFPNNRDMFEFTIATPLLRSQFRLPRKQVNALRIMLEKALFTK